MSIGPADDPDRIRRDIERTRRELSEDVNALGEKVNPASIARRQGNRLRQTASNVRDSVMGTAADARDSVMGTASDMSDRGQQALATTQETVADAPRTVARKTQGSPVAAGLIAFGAGMLAAAMLPASRVEQQAAQAVKESAQPMMDELTSVAKETAQHLKEPAQHAVEKVQDAGSEAAQAVKDDVDSAAGQVKEQARDSKETVQRASS